MNIEINAKATIFEQIVNQITEHIALGIYKPSEKLPSVRELSSQLKVNPNTIQKAYRELENRGFIYSIKGKGNYVSEVNDHSRKTSMDVLKRSIRLLVVQSHYVGIDEPMLNTMIHQAFIGESEAND